jgi:hypothetical protein
MSKQYFIVPYPKSCASMWNWELPMQNVWNLTSRIPTHFIESFIGRYTLIYKPEFNLENLTIWILSLTIILYTFKWVQKFVATGILIQGI